MPELYQRVLLNRDFPEYNLKKGDIATLVDTVPHPAGGEEGYILEIFNDLGESINTVVVPCSTVESLNYNGKRTSETTKKKMELKPVGDETVESLSQKIDAEYPPESINYTNAQYNPDIDELKISWSQVEIQKTNPVSPGIILDYDTEGNVIGIKILNASQIIENLHQ
jgi:uncharacterized protein YuzE